MAINMANFANNLGNVLIGESLEQKREREIFEKAYKEGNDEDHDSENQTGELQGD